MAQGHCDASHDEARLAWFATVLRAGKLIDLMRGDCPIPISSEKEPAAMGSLIERST